MVICILLFSDIDVIACAVVRSVYSPFNIFVPYILPAAITQQCNAVVAFHIHFVFILILLISCSICRVSVLSSSLKPSACIARNHC